MKDMNIKLSGWQAGVFLAVLVVLIVVRLVTMRDLTGNEELMARIQQELSYEYLPRQMEQLEKAHAAGDEAAVSEVVQAVSNTRLSIHEVKGSSPILDFTSPYEVVMKITYSVDDSGGQGEEQVAYHLFERQSTTGSWRHRRKSTMVSYYLNFL